MIAIPRFPARRARSAETGKSLLNPYVGTAAAAVLLAITVVMLAVAMGSSKGAPRARIALADASAHAPAGWRLALRAPGRTMTMSEEMVRLSDRPISAASLLAGGNNGSGGGPVAASGPLPPAPIAGLYNMGPGGPLPIIATDGRTPFNAYRRPFESNGRPRIALVIGGLGLNARATQQAIETLPGQITLSFAPYAEGLQGWIDMARDHGHEVLLETPMEPVDYPDNDPGPYTLMAAAQPGDTVKKLEWILSRASGYFGLTNYLGSRFLASNPAYASFAGAVGARGLAFFDDGSARQRGGGLPRGSADRVIDDQLSAPAIDQQLMALEGGALQHGKALGAGFAYPVTLEKVARWAQQVEARGFQLAPASALAEQR
jgi:polysaccharide deacetylase 2 family uncharacterized protein YibQ